jgi:conjugal transfer pilus assembly protein TraE
VKLKFMSRTWEMSTTLTLWLAVSNTILVALLFVMGNAIFSMKERIVLVPPHLNERAEVGWNSATESYYKSFGLFFAILVGNITPSNVDFVIDILSTYLDPEIYTQVRPKLIALSQDAIFRESGGASVFSPGHITYEPETSKVFVQGVMTMTSYAKSQPEIKNIIYEIAIHIKDGLPKISYLNSYEGAQPRTLKWMAANPEQAKQTKEQAK